MSLDVVAVGARTPVGLTAEPSAAAVRARICRIAEYPFVTATGEPMHVAADARLSRALEGKDRLMPLARSALDEVLRKIGPALARFRGPIEVRLALPEARPGLPEREVTEVARALAGEWQGRASPARVEVAGRGHAGVAQAVTEALRTSGGDEGMIIVLGVDSYLHPETLVWLERERKFGPEARSGFVPGEGAGCVALAGTRVRRQLGLPCLATVDAAATEHEPRSPKSEAGSLGEGLTRAVTAALARCELPREAVDAIYTDINGERHRSEEWGFVALRAPAAFKTLNYEAPADCWGDVGAASGALACVLAAQSWARDYARGPRALVLSGSPHGLRGAILLRDPRLS